ncbi:hypothetical protein RRG08_059450 [Elysia crispata]|uniref:Uncharacterized protein n=1 Tax=Elysia crispata TaxID=231223 RepID=A0AAE1A5F4_9GAST|nr:hypothetical protein RRG08_059450 [Elysia crispata]
MVGGKRHSAWTLHQQSHQNRAQHFRDVNRKLVRCHIQIPVSKERKQTTGEDLRAARTVALRMFPRLKTANGVFSLMCLPIRK